jgi:hypothetical protein
MPRLVNVQPVGILTGGSFMRWHAFVLCLASVSSFAAPATTGASYSDVWKEVQKTPYKSLPSHSVTKASFFKAKTWFSSGTNQLAIDAKRTIAGGNDILPTFQKLVHPIGICFSGVWNITEKSKFTGYFAQGSKGLIITRASEAMGNPLAVDFRALGLAGKLFPTSNAKDTTKYTTANFFTVDDLGGQVSKSYLDRAKTNAPPISKHFSTFFALPMILTIANAFSAADQNPSVRQLYPIAELGMPDPSLAVTPALMSLKSENVERPGNSDFRNELRLRNFKHGLVFSISVAAKGAPLEKIGTIEQDEEALTEECDYRLHFPHPESR